MKLRNLFRKRNIAIAITATASLYASLNAAELTAKRPVNPEGIDRIAIVPPFEKPVAIKKAKGVNATADIQLVAVDGLANAYSFYTNGTNPFVYDPVTAKYYYVQRGPGETDTKNNIYLRSSADGVNWSEPVLVYNYNVRSFPGRYPSVSILSYDDKAYAVVSCPTLNANGQDFNGVATTVYDLVAQSFIGFNHSPSVVDAQSRSYTWSTDGKMLSARTNDNKNVALSITHIYSNPQAEGYMSGFGMKRTEDFTNFTSSVPPQFSSEYFMSGSTSSPGVYSELLGTEKANGKFYAAFQGRFAAETSVVLPGFSVSENYGATWGPIEVAPKSIFNDYFEEYFPGEIDQDSFYLNYNSKGFTVLENGNVYFTADLYGKIAAQPGYVYSQIVEIFKENNVWGVRRIAGKSNYAWYPMAEEGEGRYPEFEKDANGNYYYDDYGYRKYPVDASTDNEFQLTRSVDGQTLVFKYLQPQYTFKAYDSNDDDSLWVSQAAVIVGHRSVGSTSWNLAYLTSPIMEGVETYADLIPSFNRLCFLPNRVPNDLKNIPFLMLKTQIPDEVTSPLEQLLLMANLFKPQVVYSGVFNYTDLDQITSVEDNNTNISNVEIKSLSPNPLYGEEANVNINVTNSTNVKVELFDILGNPISTVFDGFVGNGVFSLPLDTKNISNGIYNVVVTSNGIKVSKQLSIVR